jgi:hypothetical protein
MFGGRGVAPTAACGPESAEHGATASAKNASTRIKPLLKRSEVTLQLPVAIGHP